MIGYIINGYIQVLILIVKFVGCTELKHIDKQYHIDRELRIVSTRSKYKHKTSKKTIPRICQ